VGVVLEWKAKMPNGRSHFRRYHDERHSSRRRRDERHRSPHRRRRDGDELPQDLPQHPDGVDGVPTNDGFQGSGYQPDSELQVLVDTPRCGTSTTSVPMASISEAIVRGMQEVAGKLQKTNVGRSVSMHTSLIKNIVAEFNPVETDVTSWIHEVDEYAIIYGWDSKTTSHLALSKLRGAAEVCYRGLPSHLFT
jgi:hypothetical protein